MRITPLALAAGLLLCGGAARAQAASPSSPPEPLQPSRSLLRVPDAEADKPLPIILRARSLQGRPDLEAVAEGDVELRRGSLLIRADRLSYDGAEDLAAARGAVRIERDGAIYRGPELQLRVKRFEGFFLQPEFEFLRLGTGGSAERVDFLGDSRSRATGARYTSCPRDGSGAPDWVLKADRVTLDLEANEGFAEGAVLRFLDVPILALPSMSFPLNDARRSGWLPPSVNLDSRSGLEISVPYYWNIAPNRDATIAPRILTRRGIGLDAEFRYLEPSHEGALAVEGLPNDKLAGRSRSLLQWTHESRLPLDATVRVDWLGVSDDAWWKDFPGSGRSLTQRLLSQRASIERVFGFGGGDARLYARVQHWQVLQDVASPIVSPYQRSPQIGARAGGSLGGGVEWSGEIEFNRFTLPDTALGRPLGERWHALGALSRPFRESGWWWVPRLSFNAASYRMDQPLADGRLSASRVIPTFSIDAGFELERETRGFGRALRQTLEPRLLYARTPYRQQDGLPNFDAAGKDFNFSSIYSENAFSGIDRVSDSHQLTAGATTRLVDAASGAELLRLGIVQRYLLSTQRVTAQADGTADGPPLERRFSDLLLLGSTNVLPSWTLDASLQYSPDTARLARSIVGARYSPGPFRTVSATYRLARGLSEQLEVGWQWPIWSAVKRATATRSASSCTGTLYGVGRVNYNMKDSRINDSLFGLEYDAGCWIGRVVAERQSTGLSQATTRLMLQLELVGLSRLGSNPLKVLKDNVPGYRLLRDEPRAFPDPAP
jgi:LPS-assembly protein